MTSATGQCFKMTSEGKLGSILMRFPKVTKGENWTLFYVGIMK